MSAHDTDSDCSVLTEKGQKLLQAAALSLAATAVGHIESLGEQIEPYSATLPTYLTPCILT